MYYYLNITEKLGILLELRIVRTLVSAAARMPFQSRTRYDC